jgi:hypothetical protein
MKHCARVLLAGFSFLHSNLFIGMIHILCEGFNPASSVIPLTFTKYFSKTERVKLTVSYISNFDLFDSCVQVPSNAMASIAPPSTILTSLVDPADAVLLGGLMLNPGW